jgi:hypothetical protein
MSMHYWEATWGLDVKQCPCDVHFLEFLQARDIKGASIFHFGTGSHHIVGLKTAEDGSGNAVLGITASTGEYDAYVKLAIDKPAVTHSYKAFFGDIYLLEPRLLPEFDVVTLFHLCEFRTEKNDAYGALTDLELAEMLVDKMRPGGWMLFYKGSMSFDKARPVIDKLVTRRPLKRVEDFETLEIYRKA